MKCGHCKHWGKGDGTGMHYDAGAMNYCDHLQIAGVQHPSYGACGEPTSMLYSGELIQNIMTRYTFGCVLFEEMQ
jgi:hypothetical protein